MKLAAYSIGMGDRFGLQTKAQLAVVQKALENGVEISPVWNKSFREHAIIGSNPDQMRQTIDRVLHASEWNKPYFLDADHISMTNVELFIDSCNFFTIDVANSIGAGICQEKITNYTADCEKFIGKLPISDLKMDFGVTKSMIGKIAAKYLPAIEAAAEIYKFIKQKKADEVVIEISMDETDKAQTPVELFFILMMIAQKGIPCNTVAPKFSGDFFKGIEYRGDVEKFEAEFRQNLLVIEYAVREFELPADLKLSVHSGSDKFALYPLMNKLLKEYKAGVHLKTAGTNWLEEITGLAEAGARGFEIVKEIYSKGWEQKEELCKPYANVIDIDFTALPTPEKVNSWCREDFAAALRHDQSNKKYNLNLRQLLHISYKAAAKMGDNYLNTVRENEKIIAENVYSNLWNKHVIPLFF